MRDPPLTAHGSAQVRILARHLQGKDIAAIFSSPFWRCALHTVHPQSLSPLAHRCLQTATPVAEALDLPILIEPGISCAARATLHAALHA
jgi:transcription factor C subunit 7